MATRNFYCDQTAGNDSNDGFDGLGLGLTSATYTHTGTTLTHASIASYTPSATHTDVIYLSSAADASSGWWVEVASVDGTTITLGDTVAGTAFSADRTDVASGTGPKKTAAAMDGMVANAGDAVLFKRGEVWREGNLAITSKAGTDGNRIRITDYGNPGAEAPSLRAFTLLDSGWSDGGGSYDPNPGNVWQVAWTGGASAFVWVDNVAYTRVTWDTDPATTFGADPQAGQFTVDTGNNLLYLVATATNPNSSGEIIEATGTQINWILRLVECEYFDITNLDFQGALSQQFRLESNTVDTMREEILFDGCTFRKCGTVGIHFIGAELSGRSTLTARNNIWRDWHPQSESNAITATSGGAATGSNVGHVLTIEDNTFKDGAEAHGIQVGLSTTQWCTGVIRRNKWEDWGDDAVWSQVGCEIPAGEALKIYDNVIIRSGDDGIELVGAQNCKVWNNTIVGCSDAGIHLEGTGDGTCECKNNLIVNARQGFDEVGNAYELQLTADVDSDYNLIFNTTNYSIWIDSTVYSTLAAYQAGESMDPNSVAADPRLAALDPVDERGCHIFPGSPAWRAGVDLSGEFTTDFYGRERKVPFSIGAIEPFVGGQIAAFQ